MKESKQCGNCVGIFSFLSETSTVLCMVLYCGGAHAVSEHAVLFTADTERVSLVHLFHCRWRQFKLNVASMWQRVKLKGMHLVYYNLGVFFFIVLAIIYNCHDGIVPQRSGNTATW